MPSSTKTLEKTEAACDNEPVVKRDAIGETAIMFTTEGQGNIDQSGVKQLPKFGMMNKCRI
jgi:hypothetical protein